MPTGFVKWFDPKKGFGFILSPEGEDVILGLIKSGIRFHCSGVFTKHVVKELTRRARRNLRMRAGD